MIWNEKIECASRDEMKAIQSERLTKTVQRIYHNIPSYRAKMQETGLVPGDIKSAEDLPKLPFTNKTDLRDNYPFGMFTVPISDPENAVKVLKENGFSVQTTEVILLKTHNHPGALSKMLEVLNVEQIFIEYLYAFSMNDDSSIVVIRPSDMKHCMEKLEEHTIDIIKSEKL
jgi:hypothetical protein